MTWAPGDIAIAAGFCPRGGHNPPEGIRGRSFLVVRVGVLWDSRPIFWLAGRTGPYCADCFRKVEKAEVRELAEACA